MRFDDRYPDAPEDFRTANNGRNPGVLKVRHEYYCVMCETPTKWVNEAFDAPVCSEECDTKVWDESALGYAVSMVTAGTK